MRIHQKDTQMQCCFSDKGTKLILKGGEKTKYRVCLFADGKLMKVNKNAEYVDVVANGKKAVYLSMIHRGSILEIIYYMP